MYHLYYLCLVFFMLLRLFFAVLWSPAGKGLTSWLLFVMFNCVIVTFPCRLYQFLIFATFLILVYRSIRHVSDYKANTVDYQNEFSFKLKQRYYCGKKETPFCFKYMD